MPNGLHPSAQAWWRVVWASPMAAMYLDADVYPLTRLARLLSVHAAGEADYAAEIRQLEDRFGLSPAARRRLQWEVAAPGVPLEPVSPVDGRFLRGLA